MNKFISLSLLVFVLSLFPVFSQNLEGKWVGELDVMNQKLKMILTLDKTGDEWEGKLDIPQQGAIGLKASKTLFDGLMLFFEINQFNIAYEGVVAGDIINGTFQQNGIKIPLDFKKSNEESLGLKRPQHPKAPFPYIQEEVSFLNNETNLFLHGTLTKPSSDGIFPTVVLVGGSGPSDRNNQVLGHEPFLVLADHLTKNGIMVLRFDERGVGKSEGDFKSATYSDLVKDVHAALEYLNQHPNSNKEKVGVIGHSEGGMIAYQISSESQIPTFLVSLAGPVVPIVDLMAKQTEDVYRSAGMPKDFVEKQVKLNTSVYHLFKTSQNENEISLGLNGIITEFLEGEGLSGTILTKQKEDLIKAYSSAVNPWFLEFIKLNPELVISKIKIPIFAAFGGKDTQVNASQNGNRLVALMADQPSLLTLKIYPELNHLFQTASTGSVNEYAQIEETFNVQVLEDIVQFILKR
jgi:uncharacterized protein